MIANALCKSRQPLGGANPDAKTNEGDTPLRKATEAGHEDAIRLLLDAGADPNARISDGDTPLHGLAADEY